MTNNVITVSGQVFAQFPQFSFYPGDGSVIHQLDWDRKGLVRELDGDRVMLTSARQGGPILFQVEVHEHHPEVRAEWTDLVEFSVTAGDHATMESWGQENPFPIPAVRFGVSYRVRYIIVDGALTAAQEMSDPQASPVERYILQLWPQEQSPPAAIRCESPWARYWEFGKS